MTEQELEARMKQIINEYAPILNAKPIEEIKKEVKGERKANNSLFYWHCQLRKDYTPGESNNRAQVERISRGCNQTQPSRS